MSHSSRSFSIEQNLQVEDLIEKDKADKEIEILIKLFKDTKKFKKLDKVNEIEVHQKSRSNQDV